MVGPAAKREGVAHLQAVMGLSEWRAYSIVVSGKVIKVIPSGGRFDERVFKPGNKLWCNLLCLRLGLVIEHSV